MKEGSGPDPLIFINMQRYFQVVPIEKVAAEGGKLVNVGFFLQALKCCCKDIFSS